MSPDLDGKIPLSRARCRWQILRKALLEREITADDAASVRRVPSYGLWISEAQEGSTWVKYQCSTKPFDSLDLDKDDSGFDLTIRFVDSRSILKAGSLIGFNNTGNVCIWPSEEILAFYCSKRQNVFNDASVIELGGGMICFAGLVVAKCSAARRVVLSDGNSTSVENVGSIVPRNSFGASCVEVSEIRWDERETWEALRGAFDIILCSDCLFFDAGRQELVNCIYELLVVGGKALITAPRRGKTLEKFIDLAEKKFFVHVETDYDEVVTRRRDILASDPKFDGDLHYPLLVTLSKK